MARQYVSSVLMVACFLASVLVGLANRQQASGDGSGLASNCTETCDFITSMYGKLMECAASVVAYLPIVGGGLVVGTMTMGTLFVMTRFFDPDPYLYNNGKLGRLEAQSIYSSKKC